jgi:hypothetical protein
MVYNPNNVFNPVELPFKNAPYIGIFGFSNSTQSQPKIFNRVEI